MNSTRDFLAGMLIGSLAGAATTLLIAPQSGKKTRALIQDKSVELRDRTTEAVDQALAEAQSSSRKIANDVQKTAGRLKQQGQDKIVAGMDQATSVLEAGKTAVKDA